MMTYSDKVSVVEKLMDTVDHLRSRNQDSHLALWGGSELCSTVRHRLAEVEVAAFDWIGNSGGVAGAKNTGRILAALSSAAKGAVADPYWEYQHGMPSTVAERAMHTGYFSGEMIYRRSFPSKDVENRLIEEAYKQADAAEVSAVKAIADLCKAIREN